MGKPLNRAVRRERVTHHAHGARGKLLVFRLLGGSLHEEHHGIRRGTVEAGEQCGPRLRLPLPGLDVTDEHYAAVGHHRRGIAEGVHGLGIQRGGRALVEVEVAQGGVERPVEDQLRDLVLQKVLGAVEVVRGGKVASLDRAADAIERLDGHAGS
jgi:hypothetical protein